MQSNPILKYHLISESIHYENEKAHIKMPIDTIYSKTHHLNISVIILFRKLSYRSINVLANEQFLSFMNLIVTIFIYVFIIMKLLLKCKIQFMNQLMIIMKLTFFSWIE